MESYGAGPLNVGRTTSALPLETRDQLKSKPGGIMFLETYTMYSISRGLVGVAPYLFFLILWNPDSLIRV